MIPAGEAGTQIMERSIEKKDKKEPESISFNIRPDRWLVSFQEILMFLLTIIYSALAAYLYEKTAIEIAGIAILAGAGVGCVIFAMEQSIENESFLYDNGEHLWRFVIIYLLSFGGSVLFPMLPAGSWPYLVIFVGLMFFSNRMIGLSAGSVLLMITVLIEGNGIVPFLNYFISGLVGIMVFSYIYETFKIWPALMISMMIQAVCLLVQEVLPADGFVSAQMLLVPAFNLLVCLILLLLLLKYFSSSFVYRNRDLYMEINDPEHPLLVELKSSSKEEYYHAIHTAYLCDRIGKRLELRDRVIKACGYYHRIGVLRGENNWENLQTILEEQGFPEEMKEVLKEYMDDEERVISREAVVLMICDSLISSISYLFSRDSSAELEYSPIINMILKKIIESGKINHSDISFGEIQTIRKILLEEQLYYEFLR